MNETVQNIISRRSIRKYKSDMIPQEIIEEIVKAGTYAPTGMNMQSPMILVNKECATPIYDGSLVMGNLMNAVHSYCILEYMEGGKSSGSS